MDTTDNQESPSDTKATANALLAMASSEPNFSGEELSDDNESTLPSSLKSTNKDDDNNDNTNNQSEDHVMKSNKEGEEDTAESKEVEGSEEDGSDKEVEVHVATSIKESSESNIACKEGKEGDEDTGGDDREEHEMTSNKVADEFKITSGGDEESDEDASGDEAKCGIEDAGDDEEGDEDTGEDDREEDNMTSNKVADEFKMTSGGDEDSDEDASGDEVEGGNEDADDDEEMTPTTLSIKEFPIKYELYKYKNYTKMEKTKHNSEEQLNTISYMVQFRDLLHNPPKETSKEKSMHHIGYRFPLKNLMTTNDCPQVKHFANRFYFDKNKRKNNMWLYYYPSTALLEHDHLQVFLRFSFPLDSDRYHITKVLNDKHTEAMCIAVHDSLYLDEKTGRLPTSIIVGIIVFRMMPTTRNGVFVYYLAALQDYKFNDVCSTPSFQKLRCPILNNGFGELLLRNCQLFCYGLHQSYTTYLGTHFESRVNPYYEKRGFQMYHTWRNDNVELSEELKDCINLESGNVDMYNVFVNHKPMTCLPLNGLSLLQRHVRLVPRSLQKLTSKPHDGYLRLINKVFDRRVKDYYVADKWSDDLCFDFTEAAFRDQYYDNGERVAYGDFHDGSKYIPNEGFWKSYHKLWSYNSRANFWDLKPHFKKLLKDGTVHKHRCQDKLMPVEEMLMTHVSVGRKIVDNRSSYNKEYNLICNMCESNMTESPLDAKEVVIFGTRIIHTHFIGRESHLLCLSTHEQMQEFQSVQLRKRFIVRQCNGYNKKKYYTELFKATLNDYLVPNAERDETCVGTHHLYTAFLKQYVEAGYNVKMFERAIKGSAKTLKDFHGKGCIFPDDFLSLIKHEMKEKYTYQKNMKRVHDSILDKHTKKYFDRRNTKKPLRRLSPKKRKLNVSVKNKSKKEIEEDTTYTEGQVKNYWKTLMLFNAYQWDPKIQKPTCVKHITVTKGKEDESHWVGRSDIGGEKYYFLVSANIIPDDPPYYVFEESFLRDIVNNYEYDIPKVSRIRLRRIARLYERKSIDYIVPLPIVDGVQSFVGEKEDGTLVGNFTQEWVDEHFKEKCPVEYKM